MSSRRAEQRRRVFCDKSNAMKKDCSTTDHRTPSVSSTSLQGANDKRQPPVASARSRSVTGRACSQSRIPRHHIFVGSYGLPVFEPETTPRRSQPPPDKHTPDHRPTSSRDRLGSAVSSTPFPASLLEELGMTDDVDNHDQDEGIDDDDDDVDEVARYSWSDTISACRGNFHTMQPADHSENEDVDDTNRAAAQPPAAAAASNCDAARRSSSVRSRATQVGGPDVAGLSSPPLQQLSTATATAAESCQPSTSPPDQSAVVNGIWSRLMQKLTGWFNGVCYWMMPALPGRSAPPATVPPPLPAHSQQLQSAAGAVSARVGRAWCRRLLLNIPSAAAQRHSHQPASPSAVVTPTHARLVGRKSSVAQRKAWNDDDKPSSSSSAAANGPTKNRPPLSNGPGSPSPSSSSAAAPAASSAGRKMPLLPRDVRSQLEEISGWPASPYRTRQLKACLAQLPVDNLYITHWLVTSRFINAANVPFFSKLLSVKPAALQAIVDEADLLFHHNH